jgi:hypothetical protein
MAIRITAKQARSLGIDQPKKPRKKRTDDCYIVTTPPHQVGRVQTLTLPGFHPLSVNTLLSRHWFRRSKTKRAQEDLVRHYAKEQKIETASGKRRVTYLFQGWHQGGVPDANNLLKVLEDNLVSIGLLVDDSPTWYENAPPQIERSKDWLTTITLEDV